MADSKKKEIKVNNGVVDHEARASATRALDQIDAHTRACELSNKKAEKASDRMIVTIERLHTRNDKVMWMILATLAAVIGQIVLKKIGLL
jgi:hypothetical protein